MVEWKMIYDFIYVMHLDPYLRNLHGLCMCEGMIGFMICFIILYYEIFYFAMKVIFSK